MRRPSLFRLISLYSATVVVVLGLTAGTLVSRRVSGYIEREHRDIVGGLVRRLANLIEQTTAERLHEVRILRGLASAAALMRLVAEVELGTDDADALAAEFRRLSTAADATSGTVARAQQRAAC